VSGALRTIGLRRHAAAAAPVLSRSATAASLGLLACGTCRLLCSPARPGRHGLRCPRCHSRLHPRRPDSIGRSWALLCAAALLYVPANVLPIMQTASLFGYQSDTILSGILFLWQSGSWPLAIVVFVASFLVPLGKLLLLAFLLWSVQRRVAWSPRRRTALYRLLESIGRWSMLDIFVMTLLVAIVQVRSVAQIRAEPGAIAFGAVVVLTMLAAFSFDPRLIWDTAGAGGDRRGR